MSGELSLSERVLSFTVQGTAVLSLPLDQLEEARFSKTGTLTLKTKDGRHALDFPMPKGLGHDSYEYPVYTAHLWKETLATEGTKVTGSPYSEKDVILVFALIVAIVLSVWG
jgi:hypothetical protein